MAQSWVGNTIVVSGSESVSNINIHTIQAYASTTIYKISTNGSSSTQVFNASAAGYFPEIKLRSAGKFLVSGSCTIYLR